MKKRRGLSLIEVLVVVAIISVLIALLMGAVSSLKETARRAACTGNLKNWGVGFASYAADHDKEYPKSFMMGDGNLAGMPVLIQARTDAGSTYGTPLAKLEEYGITKDVLLCPSAASNYQYDDWNGDIASITWWGTFYLSQYMLLPDLQRTTVGPYSRFSTPDPALMPGISTSDSGAAQRILAADNVFWTGGPAFPPTQNQYLINHTAGDIGACAYQSRLFGDGSVTGRNVESDPFVPFTDNFSYKHATTYNLHYWSF